MTKKIEKIKNNSFSIRLCLPWKEHLTEKESDSIIKYGEKLLNNSSKKLINEYVKKYENENIDRIATLMINDLNKKYPNLDFIVEFFK